MKRSMFDAEYDRVREEARRQRTEFFDPDEPAEARSAARVRGMRDAYNRHQDKAEADSQREQGANQDAARRDFNRRLIDLEYIAAGLEPPAGSPVSLGLLRSLGWTVEYTTLYGEERATLMRPVTKPAKQAAVQDGDAGDDIPF